MKFNLKLTKIISILATFTAAPIFTLTTIACDTNSLSANNPMALDDTKIKFKLGLETLDDHGNIIPGIFLRFHTEGKLNLILAQSIGDRVVNFPNDGTKSNCEINASKLLSFVPVVAAKEDTILNLPKVIGNDGKKRYSTLDDFAYVDDPAFGTLLKNELNIEAINSDSTNNRDAFSKKDVEQYVLQLVSNNELVFTDDNLEVESQGSKILKAEQIKNIKNPVLEFKWKKKIPKNNEKTKFTYSEVSSLKSYKITLTDKIINRIIFESEIKLLEKHPFKINESKNNFAINKKINETNKWLDYDSQTHSKVIDLLCKSINKAYSVELIVSHNEGFNPENEKITSRTKIKVRLALFKNNDPEVIAYLGSESDLITPLAAE